MRRSHFSLLIVPTLIAAAHALAAVPTTGPAHHLGQSMMTECESARLSSWFEGQRMITDGNVDPMPVLPTPVECLRHEGRAAADDHEHMHASRTQHPGRTQGPLYPTEPGA